MQKQGARVWIQENLFKPPVIYCWPVQSGTSVMVPLLLLCPLVYGLWQCGQLNTCSYPVCCLFFFVFVVVVVVLEFETEHGLGLILLFSVWVAKQSPV